MNKRVKNVVYDLGHKIWVSTCLVATVGATAFLGYNVYCYFKYVKPVNHEREERLKEELLKEGRMLQDSTPTLNP